MRDYSKISRRGVYYDLSLSPYSVNTEYGDIFKFSSKKRMEIYQREIINEINRVEKLIDRYDLREFVPSEVVTSIRKAIYQAVYKRVEG